MSRVGKLPISLPSNVTVKVGNDNLVEVSGPLGSLKQQVDPDLEIKIEEGVLTVIRPTEQKRHRAMHGLYRALIQNMVTGVSTGYEIKQELVGVGYKATSDGQLLELHLGFSHPYVIQLPPEVSVVAVTERRSNPIITLKSIDKQLIGQVAAKIRSLRPPEPYKGKGVKFVNEVLRRKSGKAAGS
jgi:large subunit ribosomal protein L6